MWTIQKQNYDWCLFSLNAKNETIQTFLFQRKVNAKLTSLWIWFYNHEKMQKMWDRLALT